MSSLLASVPSPVKWNNDPGPACLTEVSGGCHQIMHVKLHVPSEISVTAPCYLYFSGPQTCRAGECSPCLHVSLVEAIPRIRARRQRTGVQGGKAPQGSAALPRSWEQKA